MVGLGLALARDRMGVGGATAENAGGVTTSIARTTTPPTTRRFDPGPHRLVRDRGGHRYTFGTLRLRAGKQARMGVGEEDRLPRVRSKPHDAVSGRVAKGGRNETHAGHELRGKVLLQLHRVTTSRRVADAQPESAHERFPIPFSRRGSPDKERGYRRRFQLWDSFFDAAPARSTGNSSPSACLVSLPGRHRDTVSGGRQISSDVPP